MCKKYLKIAIKAAAAFLAAFLLVNAVCFYFYSLPPTFRRSENATWVIYKPNSTVCQRLEGGGVLHVDKNGYLNPDLPLNENGYVLALGSSHTAGKEVNEDERYTALLNNMLGDSNVLNIYNMGADGHDYTALMRGFNAATEQFPKSRAVVLEIFTTVYNFGKLGYASDWRDYDERKTAGAFFDNMTDLQKAQVLVKEKLPFLMMLKNKQFATAEPPFYTAFGLNKPEPEEEFDLDEYHRKAYREMISNTLANLRKNYDGEIIFLYHPQAVPNNDGGLDFDDEPKSLEAFMRACEENDIIFLNMTDTFEKAYEETHEAPYGFENTAFNSGHLNRVGHRLVAEELYKLLRAQ